MKLGAYPPIYHLVFESIAYAIGFKIFTFIRKQDSIAQKDRNWVIAGAILGAAVGSKLISWLDDPAFFFDQIHNFKVLMAGGKGIVGALVGGWIGVEFVKMRINVKNSTGDLFVFPLMAGMIIGRMGCFVTGLYDQTYGFETTLPWGYDFGDGITRHPTQIYEIIFLIILAVFLRVKQRRPLESGLLFKLFMIGYLSFRLCIEFIKPTPKFYFGFDIVQIVAVLCIFYLRKSIPEFFRTTPSREIKAKIE